MNSSPWSAPTQEKLDGIPAELKSLPQWVSVGAHKIPLNPTTGQVASVTDPATWGRFDDAVRAGRPVGFVLTEADPYCIIDLDNKSAKPLTAEQLAVHERILQSFPTYKERSISGRGYHVVMRGSVPGGGRRRGNVEVYSANRYMIFTGDVVAQLSIVDCQDQLLALAEEMGLASPHNVDDYDADEVSEDKELLERACNASNGEKFNMLSQGRWQECVDPCYPSQSEADYALISMLAFYTRNNEQIRRLFRMSALGKREKATDKYIDRAIARIRGNEPPPVSLSTPAFMLETKAQPAVVAGSAIYRRASTIVPVPVRWLWRGRIPKGKVTLFGGNPGDGKSQVTSSIAGIVTRGRLFPVDNVPAEVGNVIILNAEDDAADTIVPRLLAAGADTERVFIVDAIRDTKGGAEGQRLFNLRLDMQSLEAILQQIGGASLIVIDPISAYLAGTDSNNNSEVRATLAPLSALAAKYGVAVICVNHFAKSGGTDSRLRFIGSIGFIGAARAAFVVTRDQADPGRRLFLPSKNNLGNDSTGLAYRIESVTLEGGIETSRIVWEHEGVDITADEALTPLPEEPSHALPGARDFLQALLASGPMPAKDVERAAITAGHSMRTLHRAKKDIGVVSTRSGFGDAGGWVWTLPTPTVGNVGNVCAIAGPKPFNDNGPTKHCQPPTPGDQWHGLADGEPRS